MTFKIPSTKHTTRQLTNQGNIGQRKKKTAKGRAGRKQIAQFLRERKRDVGSEAVRKSRAKGRINF